MSSALPAFADEARGPWSHRRGVALDVGIVLAGLAVCAVYYGFDGRTADPSGFSRPLAVLALLPLLVRRIRPGSCLAAVSVLGVLQVVLTDQPGWGQLAVPLTVYAVAAYGTALQLRLAVGIGLAAAVAGPVDWFAGLTDIAEIAAAVVFCAVVVVASAAVGLLGRTRAAYVEQLIDRGIRLEQESAQRAELAASDERARIAREMHDVVAHGLSVMVVQADGARYLLDQDPQRAGTALETIAATGRESLGEMRRLLGLLRSESEETGTRPQPGLADLPWLVEQDPGPGVTVRADLSGLDDTAPVGRGVGLAAYRIVQESLTNVRKHAGPGTCVEVTVALRAGWLDLRVADDGRGAAAPDDGQGHGLLGMRERVAVHGGEVSAGPGAGGGYVVHARLPEDPGTSRG